MNARNAIVGSLLALSTLGLVVAVAQTPTSPAAPAVPAVPTAPASAPTPAPAPVFGNQADKMTPDFDKVKTGLDDKHTPLITAPDKVKAGEWFDVTIKVGHVKDHPSLEEHHVRYITLYKDEVEISRVTLHPVHSFPKVTFTIALKENCVLKAVEAPTHTAEWVATKAITVEK